MNKKIIMGAMLLAASLNTMADDYNYLTVAYNNVEQSITLSTVQKLTFDSNNVIVWTTDGQVTFPLSEMQKMTFTADPTAIQALPQQSENLQFQNGQLNVSKAGTLRVYNANGQLVRVARVDKDGAQVSLESLNKGLYIVNMGEQTIKVIK